MDRRGIMPHRKDGRTFPMSRDFDLPNMLCKAVRCLCNMSGKCTVPSRIALDADHRCEGYISEKCFCGSKGVDAVSVRGEKLGSLCDFHKRALMTEIDVSGPEEGLKKWKDAFEFKG